VTGEFHSTYCYRRRKSIFLRFGNFQNTSGRPHRPGALLAFICFTTLQCLVRLLRCERVTDVISQGQKV